MNNGQRINQVYALVITNCALTASLTAFSTVIAAAAAALNACVLTEEELQNRLQQRLNRARHTAAIRRRRTRPHQPQRAIRYRRFKFRLA